MPIWINARFLSQPVTGVQRYAREITRGLLASGADVRLVAPREARAEEFAPHIIRAGRLSGHAWEQHDLPRYLRRQGRPLLLNLCNTGPVIYAPQIATLHDVAYLRFPDSFSRRFRWLYRVLVPALLARSSAIVTVSLFSKREIQSVYGSLARRVEVVPNAAHSLFHQQRAMRAGRESFFLAVSSLTHQKNFDRLAQAFMQVSTKIDVSLKVVGSPHPSFARTTIAKAGSRGIEYLGRVSDEELASLYSRATAFVFPSLYEGFGIPPLEAQACGCPVAAARIEAVQEVLGESAVYFDPRDVSDIGRVLVDLATDGQLRDSLKIRGLDNAGRFDWAASARAIEKIYGDVSVELRDR